MKTWAWALLVPVLVFGGTPAGATIIDDFLQGPLYLQATNLTGQTILQTGLGLGHVLGGSRLVYAGSMGAAALRIVTPAADNFLFTANTNFGYFSLRYGADAPLDVNLLADGSDHFALNITSLTPGLWRGLFNFKIASGNNWFDYDFSLSLFQLNAPGTLVIPFAAFAGADLAHVQGIELDVGRFEPTFHLGMGSISTVPEPSPASLVAIAIVTLALRVTRRHSVPHHSQIR